MTHRQIGLTALVCGIGLFFLGLCTRGQGVWTFISVVAIVLLLGGLFTFLFTLRGATVSRPHGVVVVVTLLAVVLHAYETTLRGSGTFSLGWLLWALMPYGLCLVAGAFLDTRIAAIAGALVALSFDLIIYHDIFMDPQGLDFAAAFVLIFAPRCNTLIFSPLAIFIAWWFLRHRKPPGHTAS